MVVINIEELLKKNNKTSSISFRYIENFCKYLNCTPKDLISIKKN